jgi:hypothetical protein
MPVLTLELSEQLYERVKPFSRRLPAVLEVSLFSLKNPACEAASKFMDILTSNPSEQAVGTYKLSEVFQERVEALLEKNRVSLLTQEETTELDDYLGLEHVIRVVKARCKNSVIFKRRPHQNAAVY